MTEEIIIDGVNVNECKYFCKFTTICRNENIGRVVRPRCKNVVDCYFKQLKRKEQECEELKFTLKHTGLLDLMNKNVELKQECEDYKKQVSRCSEGWGKAETEKYWYQQVEQAKQEENYNLQMKLYEYKQALDEIEKIIDKMANTSILTFPDFSNEENFKMVMKQCNSGYAEILNIINKAKE